MKTSAILLILFCFPALSEAGRWKSGTAPAGSGYTQKGPCYWHPTDTGTNQCRYKTGSGKCTWTLDSGSNQCNCTGGALSCTLTYTNTERWKLNGSGYCSLAPEAGPNECQPTMLTNADLLNKTAAAAGDWKSYGVFVTTATDSTGKILTVTAPEHLIATGFDRNWVRGLPNIPVVGSRVRTLYDHYRLRDGKLARLTVPHWQPVVSLPQLLWAQEGMTCAQRTEAINDIMNMQWYLGYFSGGLVGGTFLYGYSFAWPASTINALRGVQYAIWIQIGMLQWWKSYYASIPCWSGGPQWRMMSPRLGL